MEETRMSREIDHECTSEIVCPYCGHVYMDSWECQDETYDEECPSCGKRFYYTRDVTVTYTSHKLKPDGSVDMWDELDEEQISDSD